MAAPGVDWASIEQQAIQEAMPYLMALIGLAGASLIAFGTIVLNRLKAKLAASEAVDKDTLLKSAADQGVQKAKEMAAVKLKDTGVAMTSQQKEQIAVDVVVAKVPDTTPDDAQSTVLAAVGAAKGEGTSGKTEGKP